MQTLKMEGQGWRFCFEKWDGLNQECKPYCRDLQYYLARTCNLYFTFFERMNLFTKDLIFFYIYIYILLFQHIGL